MQSQTGEATFQKYADRAQPRRRDRVNRWLPPLPGFIFLAVMTFPPLFYALYLSLVNVNSSLPNRPVSFVGLRNYATVLLEPVGQQAILTTGIISLRAYPSRSKLKE